MSPREPRYGLETGRDVLESAGSPREPRDFRTVRERLYFLGKKIGADNASLLSALEAETAAKKENRVPIGFES